MKNSYRCCICGKKFEGYGNNPEPLMEHGECCDECNWMYVIPKRIELLYEERRCEIAGRQKES